MQYTHGKAIKTLQAQDGKSIADIVSRDDGLFQGYEHVLVTDGLDGDAWTPRRISGLYDTADAAEQWARAMLRL